MSECPLVSRYVKSVSMGRSPGNPVSTKICGLRINFNIIFSYKVIWGIGSEANTWSSVYHHDSIILYIKKNDFYVFVIVETRFK